MDLTLVPLLTLADLSQEALETTVLAGVAGVFVAGFLIYVFLSDKQQLLERERLGPVEVTLDPPAPCLGQACQARISIRPPSPLEFRRITLEVEGREETWWSDSRGEHLGETHTVQKEILQGAAGRRSEVSETLGFVLSADAPPSFSSEGCRVVWTATLTVVVKGAAPYRERIELSVPPVVVSG